MPMAQLTWTRKSCSLGHMHGRIQGFLSFLIFACDIFFSRSVRDDDEPSPIDNPP